MSIDNGYATLEDFRLRFYPLGYEATDEDSLIERIIEASSRAIDEYCGRFFYVTGSVDQYTLTAQDWDELGGVDIVSLTKVEVDHDLDEDYETEYSVNSFHLLPLDAARFNKPYTCLKKKPLEQVWFPTHIAGVRLSGSFGWPAIPPPITEACLLMTDRLFTRKDAILGVMGTPEFGLIRITSIDPDVKRLLRPYMRYDIRGV